MKVCVVFGAEGWKEWETAISNHLRRHGGFNVVEKVLDAEVVISVCPFREELKFLKRNFDGVIIAVINKGKRIAREFADDLKAAGADYIVNLQEYEVGLLTSGAREIVEILEGL